MVSEIIAFFLGLFTLIAGGFFKKNIEEAYKRKRIATKLEAYLNYWTKIITENEAGLNLYVVGKLYKEQRKGAILNNDTIELRKITNCQKDEVKELFSNDKDDEFNENVLQAIESIQEYNEKKFESDLNDINEFLAMIREDKLFISDEEAAFLPWFTADEIINLRLKADRILTKIRSFVIHSRNDNKLKVEETTTEFTNIIWETIELLQGIEKLIITSKRLRQRNVILEALNPTR